MIRYRCLQQGVRIFSLRSGNHDPDVTASTERSTHTSSLPLVPQARGKIVSNAVLVAHSGLNVAVATSQSEVLDHPSSPPTTTENISHTEMILSTESPIPTGQPASALLEETTTANPGMQVGHSDDGRPPTNTNDTIHTTMVQITESAMPTTEPSPASMDITTTANPGMQIEPLDRELGVLPSEGMPTGFIPSRNSSERDTKTCSHLEITSQSSLKMAPQINEAQQLSTEGGDQLNMTVPNVTPDIIMTSILDIDGREQLEPNPVEVLLSLEKSPDIVELSPIKTGKRKMIDRGGDDSAGVPAGDAGFKKKHKTMVEEDDYSDIEFIGSWSPRKTNKKVKTTVKMENVPVKLENPMSASDVSAKS